MYKEKNIQRNEVLKMVMGIIVLIVWGVIVAIVRLDPIVDGKDIFFLFSTGMLGLYLIFS